MKRTLFVAAIGLVLAAVVAWRFQQQQQRASELRMARWQAERAEDVIPAVVLEVMEWERANLTLEEFSELISVKSGMPVQWKDAFGPSKKNRLSARFSADFVHVPDGKFCLQDLVKMVLAPEGLCADIRRDHIVITRQAELDRDRLRTVVYPLPQPGPQGLDESAWRAIIEANLAGHVLAAPGAVIVVATPIEQQQATRVIETICSLRDPANETVTIPAPPDSPMERRIRAELALPTEIDFVEQPLRDAVLELSERHGIPIVLDADRLQEASVAVDTPITKRLSGVSLQSALRLILKDLELTYMIRSEAIVVTTPEDAESHERTIAYGVRDLAMTPYGIPDVGALAELVRACIRPDSWGDGNGGTPTAIGESWMLVNQVDDIHDQVAALLVALRSMLTSEEHAQSASIPSETAVERRIREALDRPVEIHFAGTPLKDVAQFIGESLGGRVVLSQKKLEEASVSADTPVTFECAALPLREALRKMLSPLQLDFLVRDEVLQITTPEDSESQLVTRVYDTRAILEQMSSDALRAHLMKKVHPATWKGAGPGMIEFFRGLMVVSQTDHAHEQVQRVLDELTPKMAPTGNGVKEAK